MPGAPPVSSARPVFDWIDVLLGFFSLCAGFALTSALGWSSEGRLFKYGMAAVLCGVIVARRVVIGPPRVVAVRRGKTVLGILGAACMLFGLTIATIGGYLLMSEYRTPVPEPAAMDRDALERQSGWLSFTKCTRDGKTLSGRACMTPEERAREAAADEQERAAERAKLEAEKRDHLRGQAKLAGMGVALVLVGIWLDIFRSRRDTAPAPQSK